MCIRDRLKIAVAQYPLLFPANEAEIHENMRRTEDMVRSIAQNETGLDLLLFCEECIDNVGMERMEAVFTGEVLLAVENFWKRMASIAGKMCIRDSDISGDYTEYAQEATVPAYSGASVLLKGDESGWQTAVWTDAGRAYCIYSIQPLSESDMLLIVNSIQGSSH